MKPFRLLLLLACFFAAWTSAKAQILVSVSLKERLYVIHEPIVATVHVTNQTGRDITLSDTEQYQWFGFRITTANDRIIPARNAKYRLDPLSIKAGETVKRSVDLNQLYELGEFGTFRVQATIYYEAMDKFFSSRPTHIEMTEGRLIWKQVAGVPSDQPDGGQMRVFSLLAHQRGNKTLLYVRVEDKGDGSIFCTYPIGRLLDGVTPQAQFDSSNNLYVLQLVGQKAYVLTKIGSNGQFGGQTNYSAPKSRPTLRKQSDGTLQIVGGRRDEPLAQNPNAGPPPKLSDRPPGFPGN